MIQTAGKSNKRPQESLKHIEGCFMKESQLMQAQVLRSEAGRDERLIVSWPGWDTTGNKYA